MSNKEENIKRNKRKSTYRSAARRSAKTRKVRIVVLYTIIIAIVISICVALSLTVLFKVVNINVNGLTRYDEQEIVHDSGIFVGENIFICDGKNVSEKLSTNYPYIESVELDKKIPDTVTLNINEATPIGYVQNGDKNIIISNKGKVLDITNEPVTDTAIINGVEISDAELSQTVSFTDQEAASILENICQVLKSQGVTDITEIDVSNHSNPKVVYQGRMKIEFGNPTDLDEKLKSAMAIINDTSLSNRTKGTIDTSMSVSNNRTYFQQDYSQ